MDLPVHIPLFTPPPLPIFKIFNPKSLNLQSLIFNFKNFAGIKEISFAVWKHFDEHLDQNDKKMIFWKYKGCFTTLKSNNLRIGKGNFFLSLSFCTFVNKSIWVFATNSNFLIPISLQSDVVNLRCFILRIFDITDFIVWHV